MPSDKTAPMNVEDSASASKPAETGTSSKSKGRPRGPKGSGNSGSRAPAPSTSKTESGSSKLTPGFADGNSVLSSYGLSVSGRKERVLAPFKADKFFHFVEQSWNQLVRLKPHTTERFSFAEFRHASALQLYARIEAVKFDVLGTKPAAPVRIPLPRNTRVFQPIWSILANIGYVDDEDLRVTYVPDAVLPKSDDLTDPDDINGLLSCTLYDWSSSWHDVKKAREERKKLQTRDGYTPITVSSETPVRTRDELISDIANHRRILLDAEERASSGDFKLIDGFLYKISERPQSPESTKEGGHKKTGSQVSSSDDEIKKGKKFWAPEAARKKLNALYDEARRAKQQRITPRFDTTYRVESYVVSDGVVSTDPGAYGARLHWDPQLWLEYEQFVETVTPLALFSLSMPNESVGTYAWVLPVEKRDDDDSSVSARMPKASIPPVTWILSLLLQSSTLPYDKRSTFYVETDRLQNVLGLRQRYIRAAIKDPSAVEQYGTF